MLQDSSIEEDVKKLLIHKRENKEPKSHDGKRTLMCDQSDAN